MRKNEFLRKTLSLTLMVLMSICANAKINMGTINLQVGGQSKSVSAEPSTYYTVSGNWSRTGGSVFYISARSQRSCTISAIKAGTATLEWEGLINTTWTEMYWTVIVSPEPNNDKTGKCGDNLTYTFKDATKTLTISGTGEMYDYGNGGLPWLNVRDDIKKVVIESGVTSIGKWAFSNTGDIEFSMSNSVVTIGDNAFERSAITKIVLGSGVTSIGTRAFAECTSLSSISIPDKVVSIGEYAFSNCTSASTLKLGESVTTIENGAFQDCSSITSLTIPDKVSTINGYAFSGCSGLKTVTIGKGITSISNYAFFDCNSITKLSIHCKEVGHLWFNGLKSIKEITIGNEVKSIEGDPFTGVFEGYSNLEMVTIGNNVEYIGQRTFRNCSKLRTLTVPNSVKSIEGQAFEGCTGLKTVVLPKGLTSIERNLFDGCYNLASLSIPETVTSIGLYAFMGCKGLTSIEIPQNVTAIDMFAFSDCSGIKEIKSHINSPFTISTLCFNNVNIDAIKLYVPQGTKAKYETTNGWEEFKNIIEMSGTAVNNIIADDVKTNYIYSISGKLLTTPEKGINIINGRKVIVK